MFDAIGIFNMYAIILNVQRQIFSNKHFLVMYFWIDLHTKKINTST